MKTCTQCGSGASDGALKCPSCKAWLVAVGPPGAPAPAPAAQPPAASWSPPAPNPNPASAPVGAYPGQAPAYGEASAYPAQAPAYAQTPAYGQAPAYGEAPAYGQAPAYQGQAPASPAPAPAYPAQVPAFGQAPAYPAQEPAYQGQAPAYQSVAVADGDLFPRPAAAPNPAATGSWGTQPGAWPGSTGAWPGEPEPRKGRLSLPAFPKTLPKITWDRQRMLPFIAGGCAIVVVAMGLWFFVGRSHSSHPAAATHPKTTVRPRPRPTAKQRAQANNAASNDLRNALTAEKVAYTDAGTYVGSPAAMHAIEPSLGWGTRLHVSVGDAASRGDRQVVCLSETTRYGDRLSIGDIAAGPFAGAYAGSRPCPARPTAATVARLGRKLG